MLATTESAIKALLKSDPTVSPSERSKKLALLRTNGGNEQPSTRIQEERIVGRAEAARMYSRSKRFVDGLAASGILKKIRVPGRKRAIGFRYSDVLALMNSQMEVEHV